MREVVTEAASAGILVDVTGHGVARAQAPLPGAMLPPGERVKIQFER
jgi:ribose 5-phosphate isomerase RpiB